MRFGGGGNVEEELYDAHGDNAGAGGDAAAEEEDDEEGVGKGPTGPTPVPLVERIPMPAVLLVAKEEEPTAIASIAFRCANVKYRDRLGDDNRDDELLPVLY